MSDTGPGGGQRFSMRTVPDRHPEDPAPGAARGTAPPPEAR